MEDYNLLLLLLPISVWVTSSLTEEQEKKEKKEERISFMIINHY